MDPERRFGQLPPQQLRRCRPGVNFIYQFQPLFTSTTKSGPQKSIHMDFGADKTKKLLSIIVVWMLVCSFFMKLLCNFSAVIAVHKVVTWPPCLRWRRPCRRTGKRGASSPDPGRARRLRADLQAWISARKVRCPSCGQHLRGWVHVQASNILLRQIFKFLLRRLFKFLLWRLF
jgi:hypothetical protein